MGLSAWKRRIERSGRARYRKRTMSTLVKADILNLSVAERIQLAEDIWDSVSEVPEAVSLTEEEKRELDRRLNLYHQNPSEGSPWGMVREKIRNRYGA